MRKDIQNKLMLSNEVNQLMIEVIYEQNMSRMDAKSLFDLGAKGKSYDPFSGKIVDISNLEAPDITDEEEIILKPDDDKRTPAEKIKDQISQAGKRSIDMITEGDWEGWIKKGPQCANVYGIAGVVFGSVADDIFTSYLRTMSGLSKIDGLDKSFGVREKIKQSNTGALGAFGEGLKTAARYAAMKIRRYKIYAMAGAAGTIAAANAYKNLPKQIEKTIEDNGLEIMIAGATKVVGSYLGFGDVNVKDSFGKPANLGIGDLLVFPTQADADCLIYGMFSGMAVSRGLKLSTGALSKAVTSGAKTIKASWKDTKLVIKKWSRESPNWKELEIDINNMKEIEGLENIKLEVGMLDDNGIPVYFIEGLPNELSEEAAETVYNFMQKADRYNATLQKHINDSLKREYSDIIQSREYQRSKKVLSQTDENGKLVRNWQEKNRLSTKLDITDQTLTLAEESIANIKRLNADLEKIGWKGSPKGLARLENDLWGIISEGNPRPKNLKEYESALYEKMSYEHELLLTLKSDAFEKNTKTINWALDNSGHTDTGKFKKELKRTQKRIDDIDSELGILSRAAAAKVTQSLVDYSVGALGIAVAIKGVKIIWQGDKPNRDTIEAAVEDGVYWYKIKPVEKNNELFVRSILRRTMREVVKLPNEKKLIDAILNKPEAIKAIAGNFLDQDRINAGDDMKGPNARKKVTQAIVTAIMAIADQQSEEVNTPVPTPNNKPKPDASKGIIGQLPEGDILDREYDISFGGAERKVKFSNVSSGGFFGGKDAIIKIGKRIFKIEDDEGNSPRFKSISKSKNRITMVGAVGPIKKTFTLVEKDVQELFKKAMGINNVGEKEVINLGGDSGKIARVQENKQKGTKQMSKLDIRELVKEVLNENSGQGYAKYPYGSSVRDEEQPKEDYIEDWKSLSLELVRDETRDTAIQLAKLLVRDLELFEDVLDLAGQNQSVGEEILRKLKEVREKV
jgi:hypothetical protein